ncbi:sigma-54-dependent transcriptional regulator [Fulvivirga sediminis]|uniref:Sigma-54-dependent Fis family transcriptional regulator n=1 Tax=Fulvivirga sediminis TaxID=2803949 RepID=A0A937F446_9BACT|nr:sigma-54 dependent transcriptional regulator [Fulvivirga sediminis]MBL3654661.1 sigma-54-dependent Fis family transcriptional regulator [Fulvivirga sediminis]
MTRLAANILIIDDDTDVLHSARMALKPTFTQITAESQPQQINYLLNQHEYDVILLDMNYTAGATSGREGLMWLQNIIERKPAQQVVMITAYGDIKLAVEAMKIGATDFVVKPWDNEKLQATVRAAYQLSKSQQEVKQLHEKHSGMKSLLNQTKVEIIGRSPAMKELFRMTDKVADTDANIIIFGENGTGKELLAKSIHEKSDRRDNVFVKVDLGTISETLFESEMFGHIKGSFTDARQDKIGRFELAQGGTLFLDEIGNLSLPLQAKLLTAIQHKTVTRVGSATPIDIDCRIISATNNNLFEMVTNSEFREDLLYRLNTVELSVPALAERPEDVPLLADHFLQIFAHKYRKGTLKLSNKSYSLLQRHLWPGNIRELQHAMERAVIMSDDSILQPHHFLLQSSKPKPSYSSTINLNEIEKETIEIAIAKHKGNISKAAKELGLGRTTIYRKMDKYGIKY